MSGPCLYKLPQIGEGSMQIVAVFHQRRDASPLDERLNRLRSSRSLPAAAGEGRLAANIAGFARLLRSAGMPIGTQKLLEATEAVMAAGPGDPKVLYWTLHAVFVSRPSERELFNQAFHLIWRDPGYVQQLLSVMVPNLRGSGAPRDAMPRRLADSLFLRRDAHHAVERDLFEFDARGTAADLEVLATKDFEQMTADELRLVRHTLAALAQTLAKRRTRRYSGRGNGGGRRLDMRRMLRQAGSRGAEGMLPLYKERQRRAPPLVVICDISGSMDSYARLFLHFLYGLINGGERVGAFLFGTRLTNVTRILRDRDPDTAIAKAAGAVRDGRAARASAKAFIPSTRHGHAGCLGRMQRCSCSPTALTGRRAKASRARRGAFALHAARLSGSIRSCDTAPMRPWPPGAAELDRSVSEMRPCHNLRSLADLAMVLSGSKGEPVRLAGKRRVSA